MTFEDEDALLARLVRAGQADGPSAPALRAAPMAVAALLASTAAQAALAPAAVGAAAKASGATTAPLALLKWIAVGTVAGTSLMAVVHAPELLAPKPVAQVAVAVATSRGPVTPVPAAAAVAAAEPSARVVAEPASSSTAASSAPSAPQPDLAREVSGLDAARHALVAGNAAEALRLLSSLERLPGRALVPEATVLRVRALLAQGNGAEAERVTAAFCAAASGAPQCAVLRALLANNVIQPSRSRL